MGGEKLLDAGALTGYLPGICRLSGGGCMPGGRMTDKTYNYDGNSKEVRPR